MMTVYLFLRRWTRAVLALLLGIAASLVLLIVVIALLAGVLAAIGKVWPS